MALPTYPHWVLQAGAISRSAPSSGRVGRPDKFRRPFSQRSDPNKRWDASAVAFAKKVFPRAFSVSAVSARPVQWAALKQMGASAEYGIGFTVRRPLAILPSMNCAWNFARSRCCSLTARIRCSLAASVAHWALCNSSLRPEILSCNLAISFFTSSSCASHVNTGGPPDGAGLLRREARRGGTHSPAGQLGTGKPLTTS